MAKVGVKYSRALAKRICEEHASGRYLTAICKDPGMPSERTVRTWALENRDGFATLYDRACALFWETRAEQGLILGETKKDDAREYLKHLRWMLSKKRRDPYGDDPPPQPINLPPIIVQYHGLPSAAPQLLIEGECTEDDE